MWDYEEALVWLYGRQALGIKLGLGKVERLLTAIGDPQSTFFSVHVAGTNGKGSVTRMLAETLRRSGHVTGCTTSPHLVSFTERIEVNCQTISKDEVASGLLRLRGPVADLDAAEEPPTFFEIVTALAFLYFRDKGVEWAVVETGMGGRLDATNVLRPHLTIITNVALDHQQYLGDTVAEIAWEKAGIMKPGVPCVTAARGDALVVIKARSQELRCPMSIIGIDYHIAPSHGPGPLSLVRPNGESHYEVGLAGGHQHENAAVVVAAVDALRQEGVHLPEQALRGALRETAHPGRLQSFEFQARDIDPAAGDRPITILIDGAHNPAAGQALRQALFDLQWRGFDLIAGSLADKPWQETIDPWLAPCARLWAVPVRNPRTLNPEALAAAGREAGVRSEVAPDVEAALQAAIAAGANRILVAGSLFLAGEAIALLTGRELEEIRGTQ